MEPVYVEAYGIKIPVKEIEKLCRLINDRLHRDRNYASLALEVSSKNVQQWYGEINERVSPLIESGLKERKPADVAPLTKFINTRDCVEATTKTIVMLRDMSRRINDKSLRLKNFEPEELNAVIKHLDSFCEKVSEKKGWLNTRIHEERLVEISVLNKWLNELQQILDRIVETTEELNQRLGNEPSSVRKVLMYLL